MPVTDTPGISGCGLSSSPQGRTHENDASLTVVGDRIRVQLVLKCMLLVGEAAVKPG